MSDAITAQIHAARPFASSWVSANAGSGKTRVLTDRVARLLLAGTEPQRILCLTYTKAAAAEMQTRLFGTLGRWAMLDEPGLRAALSDLGEPVSDLSEAELSRARTLFARALETPGGLKIQTIHAFCEALLRRFPLEAGVSPQFRVLDDREAKALRAEVLNELAEAEPAAFAAVARTVSGDDPDVLLREIAQHRAAFAAPFDPEALAASLGAEPGLDAEALCAMVLAPGSEAAICALLPILAASGTRDCAVAETLAKSLAAHDPDARLAHLESALLTSSGKDPFTPKQIGTKAIRTAHAGLCAEMDRLAGRVADARPRRLALAAFDGAAALGRFGRTWLAAWSGRKRRLGLLDFDDMIDRAQALLESPGTAAWVLWKLDGGLDHLLVDEAQDTSPAQWRVIQAISSEFFAGEGARDSDRTIFVVGDEKQSIYSFQGADPQEFGAKSVHYTRTLEDIGDTLERCALLYSFRSAQPILDLVDKVFDGPAGAGIEGEISHFPHAPDRPGRVELWPFLPRPDKLDEPPWDEPPEGGLPEDPVGTLATRIATTIAGWLAERRTLPGEEPPRPIRPGDVMILVQRRGPIFDAVIRALKRAEVPVAGADLLRIGGELAVQDLLAALRFAATPKDDLSLAAFLRSPLGGVSERELFDLAHGRPGSLWSALRRQPSGSWPEARALLSDLLAQADYLRPFELLERMLVRHDGRRRLVARLGSEAEDGIDALIDQALAYEHVEPPSLTGFLDWIDRDEVAVKRRSDAGADQVRVMTVHGAKGLEAPIVFLPDTASRLDSANPPLVVRLADGQPVWRGRSAEAPPAVAAAEEGRRRLVREENRRLLYVALTRAQRWLIVCGAGPEPGNGAGGESWHTLVADAMEALDAETEEEAKVLTHNWDTAPAPAAGSPQPPTPLPAWATLPAGRPAAAERLISPSGLGGGAMAPAVAPGTAADEDAETARLRGIALHRLLEHLHAVPAAERGELARRLLPGEVAHEALIAEVSAILDAPGLAFLFGPRSLAEVDVTAPVPGGRILGRIDRLVVEDDRILAVDFKSHRLVPESAGLVPEEILRQLGAYRAALAPVWPGRGIEVAVLWTGAALLMPVPVALADAAFARADLDRPGGRS